MDIQHKLAKEPALQNDEKVGMDIIEFSTENPENFPDLGQAAMYFTATNQILNQLLKISDAL